MEVLIVDDDQLIREILPVVLRRALGTVTVRVEQNLEAAFANLAHRAAPDLALLDLGLPGWSGIEALRRFRWKFPRVRVVVISSSEDGKSIRAALAAGAVGYIPKTSSPDMMIAAVKLVSTGGIYVPPEATGDNPPPRSRLAGD